MKTKLPLSLLAAASLALSSAAFAAGVKTYQVTGPSAGGKRLDDRGPERREKGPMGNQSRFEHQSERRD